jgi:hypothetical protein
MSTKRLITAAGLALSVGVAFVMTPVIAHHASGPFYDPDRRVEIEGTVKRFVFRNPHAFLFVDVAEANGTTTEWQIELGAPVSLQRTGWTPETLPMGLIIKVSGQPSRADGSTGMCCVRMTRQDGSPVLSGGRVEEAVQPPR